MQKRTAAGLTIAALLGIIPTAAFFYFSNRNEVSGYRQQFRTMGTVANFTLYTTSQEKFAEACRLGKAEFRKVIKLADLRNPESELSKLNSQADKAPFPCSMEMWELLMRAETAWKESSGNFDITVKPLMVLWGFYRKRNKLPTDAEIKAAMKCTGFSKLQFDREKRTVKFTVPGMALDLGGIAKGYALDRAAEKIITCGVNSGVLDLGGNLKLLPQPPPGKNFYSVGIRNPGNPAELLKITLQLPGNSAVSTSGDYERFVTIGNRRFGHIVNPHSGLPEARTAVTVTAKSALDADIFSTSAYLGGERCANTLERHYPESKFYFTPPAEK